MRTSQVEKASNSSAWFSWPCWWRQNMANRKLQRSFWHLDWVVSTSCCFCIDNIESLQSNVRLAMKSIILTLTTEPSDTWKGGALRYQRPTHDICTFAQKVDIDYRNNWRISDKGCIIVKMKKRHTIPGAECQKLINTTLIQPSKWWLDLRQRKSSSATCCMSATKFTWRSGDELELRAAAAAVVVVNDR